MVPAQSHISLRGWCLEKQSYCEYSGVHNDDTRRYKTMERAATRTYDKDDDKYNNRHNDGSNMVSQSISSTSMTSTADGYQRLASSSILDVCTTITITVPQGQRRPTLLYNSRSRSQREHL